MTNPRPRPYPSQGFAADYLELIKREAAASRPTRHITWVSNSHLEEDPMNCPCCGHKLTVKQLNTRAMGIPGVHECPECGAVFGQCYKGESYKIRLPYWHEGEAAPEDLFYYDLQLVGSGGLERVHGWAHKTTRRIVQTG